MIKKLIDFLTTDIWRIRSQSLPPKKLIPIRILRTVLLAIQGFQEDRCLLRASSLTFYSLLSIVPVAALAFGIAKGFGFESMLERQLLERFAGQEEVLVRVFDFARTLLKNTKGGMIAGIGVIVLFWSVMKVLGHIEQSFNEIWENKRGRTLWRKFSDYFAMMLISPVLFIMSGSVTVFITTQVTSITNKVALIGFFSPIIFSLLKLTPYVLIWALFTFAYLVMPNLKVNFVSGLVAGIVAGTAFQLLQSFYISFQVLVAKYNAIYGSFAALPLFLMWLQLSWLIVLFGAELSFAHQNAETYEFEPDRRNVSDRFRKRLALQITHLLVKNFINEQKTLTASIISHKLEVPIRLVSSTLFNLTQSGIVTEIETEESREMAYQPARDVNQFTIKYVLDALDHRGIENIHVAQTPELAAISEAMQRLGETIAASPDNKLLKDIPGERS